MEWAKTYEGPPAHALLTDPPYHLTSIVERFGNGSPNSTSPAVYQRGNKGFLGQTWDGGDIAFRPETWAALKRHLHPGAFLMAFASTIGYHRMACAIEDAGFRIHPMLGWVNGSSFPKATRIDTQIDRDAGIVIERGKAHPAFAPRGTDYRREEFGSNGSNGYSDGAKHSAATDLARAWEGHRYGGQILKNSMECICVAQVPYPKGRPVDSIVRTGAGALNVDAGRVGTAPRTPYDDPTKRLGAGRGYGLKAGNFDPPSARWPANFALSCSCTPNTPHDPGCPVAVLDGQSGQRSAGHHPATRNGAGMWSGEGGGLNGNNGPEQHLDSGFASRFFFQATADRLEDEPPFLYAPKSGRRERDAGLGEFDKQPMLWSSGTQSPGTFQSENTDRSARNPHPTVKPLALSRWLASLLLPPDAYTPRRLLIPFSGSGSEMIGAALAGWDEILGIEQSPEYATLARARLAWHLAGHGKTNDAPDAVSTQSPRGPQGTLF